MTKKIMAFLATWLCFALTQLAAQSTGTLTGKVVDQQQRPLMSATVALYRQADSSLVKMALTDTLGSFAFTDLKSAAFYLIISAAGYASNQHSAVLIDSLHAIGNAGTISMQLLAGAMQEVEVTAGKALIVRKADRTVVNVDALLSAAGMTALDVLEKSPGVQVDQNGNISMRGKGGVNVFIDDKPAYLSGDDLANYLRSLPASALDQVELMTNPPAQYDAAGNAGIINLKIRRGRAQGVNGTFNLNLGQGQLTRSNNSGSFNYRKRKINLFANASYARNNNFTDLDLNRIYLRPDNTPDAYFEQKSYFKSKGNAGMLNAGVDYYLSKKSTLGTVVKGMINEGNQLNDNTSNLLNAVRKKDSMIVARNEDRIGAMNGSINLNYRTKFNDKGHGFTADADYLLFRKQTDQTYENASYFADQTLKSKDVLNGNLPAHIDIYSLKADYTLPLPAQWQLAAGAKYSNIKTNNTAGYSITTAGITLPDYDKSNQFVYKEAISAGYFNLNREFGRLSLQGGLRAEHTSSNGHQLGNIMKPDSSFTRNYTNLFPTIFLNYKLDSQAVHQLGLNYGRRIERPYYEDLNPFLYPMDKFTYYTGNPFLKPAFTQSIELSHTYKNRITTTFSYSSSRDNVNETIEIANGIYYSRPGNIGRKTTKSVSVDATLDPAKWLNMHMYSEYTNIASKSDFYNGTLNTSGSFWFLGGNIRVTPEKSWTLELSGDYRTRIFDAQFITAAFWQANLAVQKKLSKSINLKLNLNDLFYTRVINGTITNLTDATAGWVNRSDSRSAAFTFSYRFGKVSENNNKHEANGADAERSRVKN